MTSFFPDLNVWLAFSVGSHRHSAEAWNPPREASLLAYAKQNQAALVTFDKAQFDLARKGGYSAVVSA